MKKFILIISLITAGLIIIFWDKKNNRHSSVAIQNSTAILGRYLFFDTRLSLNNTKSCASCHNPAFAFSDGYRTSAAALGDNVLHNAPSLINAAYLKRYDWANVDATNFLQQIQRPLYNTHPIELGLDKHITQLQNEFAKDSLYKILFKKSFPNADSLFTLKQIEIAITEYEKTLVSQQSQFDMQILTINAYNGLNLFTNKQLNCVICHPPPYFTLATQTSNSDSVYANIGLYNVASKNQYPKNDEGLSTSTHLLKDNGRFKIPSLRNVMLTAPYMHDGSIATIEEVIDVYARGGRNVELGNNRGDGKLNKNKHPLIKGFKISAKEKRDLIEFLTSLTDSSIFYKQSFQNPCKKK